MSRPNQNVSPMTENVCLEPRLTNTIRDSEEIDGANDITSGNTTTKIVNYLSLSNISRTKPSQTTHVVVFN